MGVDADLLNANQGHLDNDNDADDYDDDEEEPQEPPVISDDDDDSEYDEDNDEDGDDDGFDVFDKNNDADGGGIAEEGAPNEAPEQADKYAYGGDVVEEGAHDEALEFEGTEYYDGEADKLNDDAAVAERALEQAEPGATHEEAAEQGAHEAPYNLLRQRKAPRTEGFKQAMDTPHSTKSYFPPTQLFQTGTSIKQRHGFTFAITPDIEKSIFHYILNQMTAKAGITKHGKAAEEALMKEFAQLEELDVYKSVNVRTLTKEQRRGALRAINLIKEKRDGVLKGRTVADGRAQRSLFEKSQTASPTVATDTLLLTILIDAHENRDVGTADVAGAYLKALMDDFVLMKFTGDSVNILCKINPGHIKNVVLENGVKVLYIRLIKAIYGCVKSALLWYELVSGHLKDMGFKLNPYNPCVANCNIKGKQCTIAWYVDDIKISHVDPEVVTSVFEQIEKRFDKMTVTRGKEHKFLGMDITYTGKGRAIITMRQYLEEALAECGMDIKRTAPTPARKSLFEVNAESAPLKPMGGGRDVSQDHSKAAVRVA